MKKLLIAVAISTAFFVGYGVVGSAYFGDRVARYGYFDNRFDNDGNSVFPKDYSYGGDDEALPSSINTANEFIAFVENNLKSGNPQEKTGAAFIINTMIGSTLVTRDRTPSTAQINDWKSRVRYADDHGWVTWRIKIDINVNSYYQGPTGGGYPNDDAFLPQNQNAQDAIVFRNGAGNFVYAIKWECANPIGTSTLTALEEAGPDFDMDGETTLDEFNPKPGDTINFGHSIYNKGPDSTNPTAISWKVIDPVTGVTKKQSASPSIYNAGVANGRKIGGEAVPVPEDAEAGDKICRQLTWTPDKREGGTGKSTLKCATVRYDYSLNPVVTIKINDGNTPDTIAEPGDKITFIYSIDNTGTTKSLPTTTCSVTGATASGYNPTPSGVAPTGDPAACAEVPVGHTEVGRVDVPSNPNTSICRELAVSPASASVSTQGSGLVCAFVASKPYVKVFGGDVAVGGGYDPASKACVKDTSSGIIAWNKRGSSPSNTEPWAGAGTQYAAMALNTINDFATTQSSDGAVAPSGLTFRNSDITATDQNGGLFGNATSSVPCVPDYFGQAHDDAPDLGTTVAFNGAFTDGKFKTSGDTTLNASTIGSGKRVVLYVDGNLYINGNVTYGNQGSWSVGTVPLFQVIVRGNIYINPDTVSQLDGIYIAQKLDDGSAGGQIYTCADTAPGKQFTPIPIDETLYDKCDTRLTVNGSMVADRILLLRTLATLRDSKVAEDRTTSKGAEVFNYSPANWLAQPTGIIESLPEQYDAITSLPPIL